MSVTTIKLKKNKFYKSLYTNNYSTHNVYTQRKRALIKRKEYIHKGLVHVMKLIIFNLNSSLP